MELGERVAARLAGLSPKLREAARYVLDHPDEIATRSLRQVARSAGMSAPTFSRVAEALDFEGYDDLRAACLSRLRAQEVSYAAKAQALQETARPGHADGTFIIHQARATIANINHMLDSIDPARIEAAARRLSTARRVILVGMMSSRPFVDYLGYIGSMAFDHWHVLGGTGGGDAALLSDAGPEDVALVISAAPYASGSIQAAAHLCRAGVHVLGITDGLESPLQAHCHSAFTVSTETPQFFTSHVATLVLIETLVGLVVQGGGASVAHRIARVEATNRDLGAYHRSQG